MIWQLFSNSVVKNTESFHFCLKSQKIKFSKNCNCKLNLLTKGCRWTSGNKSTHFLIRIFTIFTYISISLSPIIKQVHRYSTVGLSLRSIHIPDCSMINHISHETLHNRRPNEKLIDMYKQKVWLVE